MKSGFAVFENAIEYAYSLGEPGKKLPFERSSRTYVRLKFGNTREGVEIPLKKP